MSALGSPSAKNERHLNRIQVIKYCKNPEYYLEEAACEYLKANPYEEDDSYQVRLSRAYSSFEPVYTHLRNLVVGTALRRKVVTSGADGPDWEKFFKNVDLEGNSLQVFVRNIFSDAVDGGWAGILVEYPTVPPGLSIQQERELYPNARPYLVPIMAESVMDTQFKSDNDTMLDESDYGRQLSLLRVADVYLEQDPEDEFSQIERKAERVWDVTNEGSDGVQRVRYRYYIQEKEGEKFIQMGDDIFLTSPIIPYVIIPGGAKEEDAIYRPLMLDTARLNMQHWVTSADLNNMINVTANPRFVITGVWDRMKGILSSTSRALVLTDKDAKADWKGAPMDGANIIRMRLQDLMQSMKTLAVVAMNPSGGTTQPQSGISKIIDKSQNDSLLNVLVTGLEAGINQALKIAAVYMGDESEPSVTLSKSFVSAPLHSQQILALVELFNAGLLDVKLLLEILEAGDLFEGLADFSVDGIMSRLQLDENGRPAAAALSAAAQDRPLDRATREPAQQAGVVPEASRA